MARACCKVGTAIDSYALEDRVVGGDIDDYLVARWLGEGTYQETGLRPLTDWFNRNILKSVYADHGRTATTSRIESAYEALTGEDDIRRGEVVDDLRADDIDAEGLLEDFVSTSTLYRHLRECLEAEKPASDAPPDPASDWERDTVAYARETAREKAREAVRSLDNKGRVTAASEADLAVPVVLRCPDCSTQVEFEAALERGYVCREHLG